MSGISKFKRIYSEGVAAEHPDVAGQPEFANKADEILARRKKDRAQSGKNAKLDAIGRKLYNMNKIGEETELGERYKPLPVDKMINKIESKRKKNKMPPTVSIHRPFVRSLGDVIRKSDNIDKITKTINTHDSLESRFKELENRDRGEKKSKTKLEKDYELSSDGKYRRRSKVKEEVELDEKIDVGADAGATISDFVHSKSKTFKGDSKKQRIKRALGAYYGAQKEETEMKDIEEKFIPLNKSRSERSERRVTDLNSRSLQAYRSGQPEPGEHYAKRADKIADTTLELLGGPRRTSGSKRFARKEREGKAWANKTKGENKRSLERAFKGPSATKEELDYSGSYNYVIETLIDCEFAQDYETAENMFDALSEGFVSVILEEYIEEKARGTRPKKTIHAYDVDETLFGHGKKGKPNVQVHVNDASGKRVQSLSNQEFNTHKLDKDKGHSYDFSEFQSAKTFSQTSTPNKKTIKDVKRRQARGQNVHIITARSKFDKPSEFQGHLKKHGVDVPMNKIHYTGGMKGGDVGKKKVDTAKGIAKQSGAKTTHMYDDAAKVNNAFEKEKQNNPTSTKIKTHLAKPNASGETTLRSYQATKGGRTSDNPSSTTKQTQRARKKARKNMGEEMTPYEYWKQYIA